MLAERSDTTEEVVRFRSHNAQFLDTLDRGGEVGKRLNFILQEMNREANTISSKSTESEIVHLCWRSRKRWNACASRCRTWPEVRSEGRHHCSERASRQRHHHHQPAVAERLQWRYINAGSIFRAMAAEAGATLAEFGRRAETDSRIDLGLDARMVEEARRCRGVILEGRVTGWMAARHGLPALKVWLQASASTRVARIGGRDGQTPQEAMSAMGEREGSEAARYGRHHAIDMGDLSVYDLVVDTERNSRGGCRYDHLPPAAKERGE